MLKESPYIIVKLDVEDTPKFVAAVDKAMCNGWARQPGQPHPEDDEENMVFFRGQWGESSYIALNFFRINSETLRSGCIMTYSLDLSTEQYQATLDDFRENILGKILDAGFTISVMPHSGITPIQDLMTKSNHESLLRFSERAWKKDDQFHPKDHVPWLRWLVTLHVSPHRVKPAELGEWARDQGFGERAAADLQQMAETGLKILNLYDDYFTGLAQFRARSSQT